LNEIFAIKTGISKIEAYLKIHYDVDVIYGKKEDNAYYSSCNQVTINNSQNFKCRLHTLLHEAGHVIIRHDGKESFKKQFPFMKYGGGSKRGNFNHRLDVLREEIMAWDEGERLAEFLGIELDYKWWLRHRNEALKTYIEWM
jgi:hypothetical protein